MTPFRVLVTGSRDWPCHELAEQVVARLLRGHGPGLVVVHGAAPGVDTAFAGACGELGVDHEPHPARWRELGRRAGPVRNEEMVRAGAGLCLAVHRNLATSLGTKGCVRLALAAGIPCWLLDGDDATPRPITEAP